MNTRTLLFNQIPYSIEIQKLSKIDEASSPVDNRRHYPLVSSITIYCNRLCVWFGAFEFAGSSCETSTQAYHNCKRRIGAMRLIAVNLSKCLNAAGRGCGVCPRVFPAPTLSKLVRANCNEALLVVFPGVALGIGRKWGCANSELDYETACRITSLQTESLCFLPWTVASSCLLYRDTIKFYNTKGINGSDTRSEANVECQERGEITRGSGLWWRCYVQMCEDDKSPPASRFPENCQQKYNN